MESSEDTWLGMSWGGERSRSGSFATRMRPLSAIIGAGTLSHAVTRM